MSKRRPIFMAIMAAAEGGCGVHLSAAEVQELARDDHIVSLAAVGLPDDNDHVVCGGFSWISAYRVATSRVSS